MSDHPVNRPNNLERLRKAKGFTLERMEELTGISASYISRMQTGERPMSVENAQVFAKALESTPAEVLGLSGSPTHRAPGGLGEELVPYTAGPSDPLRAMETDGRYLMDVTTNSLSKLGLAKGDVVLVDGGEVCKNPPPLSAVRVQFHPDPERPRFARTLLRQFVPPSLLVTNCGDLNEEPIDTAHHDAQILGVVVWAHRRFIS